MTSVSPRPAQESPQTKRNNALAAQSPTKPVSAQDAESPPSLHVLVVDDSSVITRMGSMLLQRHGHTTHVAENGLVALQFVRRSLHLKPFLRLGSRSVRSDTGNKGQGTDEERSQSVSISSCEEIPMFDVILMDFQMPVMAGAEAIRRIRALEAQLAVKSDLLSVDDLGHSQHRVRHKIIGFSAKSDPDEIRDAFNAGMDGFMAKPFTINGFNQTLQSIV